MKKLAFACLALISLSACATDGSVNWDAVGNTVAGIGAVALGAAVIYQAAHQPPPPPPPPPVLIYCPYGCY
jgi:hypothetical protein